MLRRRKLSLPIRLTFYLVICFVAWNTMLPVLVSLTPFKMEDELQQTAVSPDGKYTARLFYKDGLTFGYGHITLETGRWHPLGYGHADLVEVAAEGLMGVSWQDARTLAVAYDATRHKNPDCDTFFVSEPKAWRDVKIIYRPDRSLSP
jgi:hypothetical protein